MGCNPTERSFGDNAGLGADLLGSVLYSFTRFLDVLAKAVGRIAPAGENSDQGDDTKNRESELSCVFHK